MELECGAALAYYGFPAGEGCCRVFDHLLGPSRPHGRDRPALEPAVAGVGNWARLRRLALHHAAAAAAMAMASLMIAVSFRPQSPLNLAPRLFVPARS